MFTRFFEHTWESVKEHLEKIFDITDETQAVVISLQGRLDRALERIEALESKLSSTTVFATMVPERNPQRIEKILDITDETHALVISLQKRIDIALERIEALESKLSSTTVSATMVPERNSQRIEPQTMIVRNPMALGADALGEIPLVDTVAEER
jgi:ribosome assembly protein YihI (activator of Der GTPase)